MIQVTYRLKLGQDDFELKVEVANDKEFFQKMSFFSNLPKVGPNGATDLVLVYRTTPEGHEYYSLVSEIDQSEFKFGQVLEKNGGGLFPKGWSPIYKGNQQASTSVTAPKVQTSTVTTPKVTKPKVTAMPSVAPQVTTVQIPATQVIGNGGNQTPQASPQNTQAVNNTLARFGIGTPKG